MVNEEFNLPEFIAEYKRTPQICYNLSKNITSLSCQYGERIEFVAYRMNHTVLNYTSLDSKCLVFTNSCRYYVYSRIKDQCVTRSSCSVSIDGIEDLHLSKVNEFCPTFGNSIFKQICFSIDYVCVNLTGVINLNSTVLTLYSTNYSNSYTTAVL